MHSSGGDQAPDGEHGEHDRITLWPIGMLMSCDPPNNCDLARDEDVWHGQDLVGRWTGGGNTSTASSNDEQFGSNWMDVWEGATLGEAYFNLNSESQEDGTAKYGVVKNCANANYSTAFGAYIGSISNGCSDGSALYPPTPGGMAVSGGFSGGFRGGWSQTNGIIHGAAQFLGGPDGVQCVSFNSFWYALSFSTNQCDGANTIAFGWDVAEPSWAWMFTSPSESNEFMKFVYVNWGSPGYMGPEGGGVFFPYWHAARQHWWRQRGPRA